MAVTTLVAIFKTENDYVTDTGAAVQLSIVKTYELLFKIVKLPSIKMLVLILVTVDVGILHNMFMYFYIWLRLLHFKHLRRQIALFF